MEPVYNVNIDEEVEEFMLSLDPEQLLNVPKYIDNLYHIYQMFDEAGCE